MIYYPLSVLMMAGIRDILVITTPHEQHLFRHLLGDGGQWGIDLSFAEQPKPEGLAQAFLIGRDFIAGDKCSLILGDNIFYGQGLQEVVMRAAAIHRGPTVFGSHVSYPERYGFSVFDSAAPAVRRGEQTAGRAARCPFHP